MINKITDSYYFKVFKYLKYVKKEIVFLLIITFIRVSVNFPLPNAIQMFFDDLSASNDNRYFINIVFIVFLIVTELVMGYIGNIRTQKIGHQLTRMIRNTPLKKLLSLPYKELIWVKHHQNPLPIGSVYSHRKRLFSMAVLPKTLLTTNPKAL